MNQGRLAKEIAESFFIELSQAGEIVDFALARIAQELKAGRRVYFRGFGAFAKKLRPGRRVRHPKTGEIIWIPPRPGVDFNASPALLGSTRAALAPPGSKRRD